METCNEIAVKLIRYPPIVESHCLTGRNFDILSYTVELELMENVYLYLLGSIMIAVQCDSVEGLGNVEPVGSDFHHNKPIAQTLTCRVIMNRIKHLNYSGIIVPVFSSMTMLLRM